LHYYKDPNWFDDRIIPITKGGSASTVKKVWVYQPSYGNIGLALGLTGKEIDKSDTSNWETEIESTTWTDWNWSTGTENWEATWSATTTTSVTSTWFTPNN
jgi:hypothetical protein